jgi:hypothetical protein
MRMINPTGHSNPFPACSYCFAFPPSKLSSWQFPIALMTIVVVTTSLTSPQPTSPSPRKSQKQALFSMFSVARSRRNLKCWKSTFFLPKILPRQLVATPISKTCYKPKTAAFDRHFWNHPLQRAVSFHRVFYLPKVPVSRLFLGRPINRVKNLAALRWSSIVWSPKTFLTDTFTFSSKHVLAFRSTHTAGHIFRRIDRQHFTASLNIRSRSHVYNAFCINSLRHDFYLFQNSVEWVLTQGRVWIELRVSNVTAAPQQWSSRKQFALWQFGSDKPQFWSFSQLKTGLES